MSSPSRLGGLQGGLPTASLTPFQPQFPDSGPVAILLQHLPRPPHRTRSLPFPAFDAHHRLLSPSSRDDVPAQGLQSRSPQGHLCPPARRQPPHLCTVYLTPAQPLPVKCPT